MYRIIFSKKTKTYFSGRTVALIAAMLIFMLMGCTGAKTKWVCDAPPCLPREQAIDRCLAQVNSSQNSTLGQCMSNKGFKRLPCADDERENKECGYDSILAR